jgi:hypothetical protein
MLHRNCTHLFHGRLNLKQLTVLCYKTHLEEEEKKKRNYPKLLIFSLVSGNVREWRHSQGVNKARNPFSKRGDDSVLSLGSLNQSPIQTTKKKTFVLAFLIANIPGCGRSLSQIRSILLRVQTRHSKFALVTSFFFLISTS